MLSEKAMVIYLIAGLTKRISLFKVSYCPETDSNRKKNKIKVASNFPNYATNLAYKIKVLQVSMHQSLLKSVI